MSGSPHHRRNAALFTPPGAAEGGRFLTTRWTMVLEAGGDGPQRDEAMEQFARAYWHPIYAHIRKRGRDPEAARDLTQDFFAQLLEKGWLACVERRETRFSTLLLTILNRFLASDYRRQSSEKRGGGLVPLSLELAAAEHWLEAEPRTEETPETSFERRFALAVLASALARLEADMRSAGRARLFEALSPFLSREPEPGEYEVAGQSLGISRPAVASAVLRLRREYRSVVRAEVAAGLTDPKQVDEEMKHLAEALGGA